MVSTARRNRPQSLKRTKRKKVWKRYAEVVASLSPSTQRPPSAYELFEFMFATNGVSSQIAEESEDLLATIMQEDKLWAWTQVDSAKAPIKPDDTKEIVGALGIDPKDPSSFSVVDLEVIHERWKSAAEKRPGLQHPLTPIIQAWLAMEAT